MMATQMLPFPREPPRLQRLPNELILIIIEHLDTPALRNLALVSRWGHRTALPLLWKTVVLKDCQSQHAHGIRTQLPDNLDVEEVIHRIDHHDDTPIIQKLLILARNPDLAANVVSLTHQCRLPTPAIFSDLRFLSFKNPTLSQDPRTLQLLKLAIRNLVNVQTLRIIFGHWNLTIGLLEGFFNPHRPRWTPVRRLWLESTELDGIRHSFMSQLDLTGLESLRIRRMSVSTAGLNPDDPLLFALARGGDIKRTLKDGIGDFYTTSIFWDPLTDPDPTLHIRAAEDDINAWRNGPMSLARVGRAAPLHMARCFDANIYAQLPEVQEFLRSIPDEESTICDYATRASEAFDTILSSSASTLTSLTLDWVRWDTPSTPNAPNTRPFANIHAAWEMMVTLSKLRFPNLRAFQIRNAVVNETKLPSGFYLFDAGPDGHPYFLDFLEAHKKLKCLAWNMDSFFARTPSSPEIQQRAKNVIMQLGTTLTDLRVDHDYRAEGETLSDDSILTHPQHRQALVRRRRFIAEFAPYMTRLEQIKIEGGIPRDEKREILRALRHCPLTKIVLIGVTFPVANTWGMEGLLLSIAHEDGLVLGTFEEEPGFSGDMPSESVLSDVAKGLAHEEAADRFQPIYGWERTTPIICTIASHFAVTVTELKFCGYNGSPMLYHPTHIESLLLGPLRHFHALRQLIVSVWLDTSFDGEARDESIISYWRDQRDPASTALAIVEPPFCDGSFDLPMPDAPPSYGPFTAMSHRIGRPAEEDADAGSGNAWARRLRTFYHPRALAEQVRVQMGRHLSLAAKRQRDGVSVRTSFCIGGRLSSDIFDLDVRIGRRRKSERPGYREEHRAPTAEGREDLNEEDYVISFKGPREEGERDRWRGKMEGRRWF